MLCQGLRLPRRRPRHRAGCGYRLRRRLHVQVHHRAGPRHSGNGGQGQLRRPRVPLFPRFQRARGRPRRGDAAHAGRAHQRHTAHGAAGMVHRHEQPARGERMVARHASKRPQRHGDDRAGHRLHRQLPLPRRGRAGREHELLQRGLRHPLLRGRSGGGHAAGAVLPGAHLRASGHDAHGDGRRLRLRPRHGRRQHHLAVRARRRRRSCLRRRLERAAPVPRLRHGQVHGAGHGDLLPLPCQLGHTRGQAGLAPRGGGGNDRPARARARDPLLRPRALQARQKRPRDLRALGRPARRFHQGRPAAGRGLGLCRALQSGRRGRGRDSVDALQRRHRPAA